MKLVTFKPASDAQPRIGLVRADGEVIDLTATAGAPFDARDMLSLVTAGAKALDWIGRVASTGQTVGRMEALTLLAPIPRPRKNIFCVGWNYVEHFNEGAKARPHVQEMPAHPAFFTKAPTTVIGPFDDVPLDHNVTEKLDWEVELAVVIGPGGKNITEDRALQHVFGYMAANDVSGRDIQRQHGQQWFKGKSLDGTCPLGPWIVTADEIPDPQTLPLACRVNGVTKQESNTRNMYFKVPRIIAELSLGLTLEPGDVILTGTPQGVGHARTPPEFMRPGDVLETEVGQIGALRNRIVEAT